MIDDDFVIQMSKEVLFINEFNEYDNYYIEENIGNGSYGNVYKALDKKNNCHVAIKHIVNVFNNKEDTLRILRELKFSKLLKHDNIASFVTVLTPKNESDFNELCIVFELMDCDLKTVLKLNHSELTAQHHQYFMYQLLKATEYLHSINVYHRDLKPTNILVNADCTLKICDFGLSRIVLEGHEIEGAWTSYVATRWYRPPELCGTSKYIYSKAIDMWSIGCIFAELLNGKPLFMGKNKSHQLLLIMSILGKPNDEVLDLFYNQRAQRFIKMVSPKHPKNLKAYFDENIDPNAIDLISKMLNLDPRKRISAFDALQHPYFKEYPRIQPSNIQLDMNEFEFDYQHISKNDLMAYMTKEICDYKTVNNFS
jgi:mitogen-activated protein kinase 1/3